MTETSVHPEVGLEQAYLEEADRCLAEMRKRTEAAIAVADNAAQEVDAAIARAQLRHRRRAMDTASGALAFGRIDEDAGERFYVGRRHVEDAQGDPVVVDWRAPVAVPFYRATAADPLGLRMRRRFLLDGPSLVDVHDEIFDDPDSINAAMHGGIPDPLLAELERERSSAMRDIVATIQAEQDVVIRAPLERCLMVQGGPGTGKTAVGLHRAAFLLYEHGQLLGEAGVLVLGPNPVFLRYIAQVLPSLGESAVRQATLEGLLGGRARAFDNASLAALKGDARMAMVLAAAVRAQVRRPVDDFEAATAWGSARVRCSEIVRAIDDITARGVPYNVGRGALRSTLLRLAQQSIVERRVEGVAPLGFTDELRASKAFSAALGSWWPVSNPSALVRRLLSSPAALRSAADGVLSESEQRALLRKRARRVRDEPWTAADLVLVDEAEALIEGVRRTYGHIVLDEAQDLTAMELRAVARRCPGASLTVLGDLAQATRPGAQRSWLEVLETLGSPVGAELTELEMGYRVPAPIIEFANRLLPLAAPHVKPSRSVRESGGAPEIVSTAALGSALERVVSEKAVTWSSVGVIVPSGVPVEVRSSGGVLVVAPEEAKGLEFDAVVVVEPAAFLAGDDDGAGLRLLYVALTRAVQELTVVHERPLPPPLA